jgi:hypothetical protein
MEGAPKHRIVRRFIEEEVRDRGSQVGLVPQVLLEFLHVCTDPRRFEQPLSVDQGVQVVRELWDSKEVSRVSPARKSSSIGPFLSQWTSVPRLIPASSSRG